MAHIPDIVVPLRVDLELSAAVDDLVDNLVAIVADARRCRVLAAGVDINPRSAAGQRAAIDLLELDVVAARVGSTAEAIWLRVFGSAFPEVDA